MKTVLNAVYVGYFIRFDFMQHKTRSYSSFLLMVLDKTNMGYCVVQASGLVLALNVL